MLCFFNLFSCTFLITSFKKDTFKGLFEKNDTLTENIGSGVGWGGGGRQTLAPSPAPEDLQTSAKM